MWVAKLDLRARSVDIVELHCGWVGAPPDEFMVLGLLGCATTENVHPACYVGVARALGKEPTSVAPYEVSSSFRGARLVAWTRDDLPRGPTGLPGVQFVVGGKASTPKRGDEVFLAMYPVVPEVVDPPTVLPGTHFALQASDGLHIYPLDAREKLARALHKGRLVLKWLSPAEADAAPTGVFTLSMRTAAAGAGAEGTICSMVREGKNWLCSHCNAPCRAKCAGCQNVAYCGAACQLAAWPAHREACGRRLHRGAQL
jgi:hypothetical protein